MAEYVVICSECGTENQDWKDENGTYWFTCSNKECEYDNEQVYARHK